MSKRHERLLADELYHIYNIGIDGKLVFRDKYDYSHFVKLLYLVNTEDKLVYRNIHTDFLTPRIGEKLVRIGAYCLMPDCFHLIVTSVSDKGISKFMQKLSTAYSMYYNIKYERMGPLFRGKFISSHLTCNKELKNIYFQIILSPISLLKKEDWFTDGPKNKEMILSGLNDYEFSSYKDVLEEKRITNKILDRSYFPGYFYNKEKIKKETQAQINLLVEKISKKEKPNSLMAKNQKEEKSKILAPV